MSYTESSITLDFPDTNYFRLCECEGYKSLQNVREMDFCWYKEDEDILYLIELKDWGHDGIDEEQNPNYTSEQTEQIKSGITNYRIKNLLEKSMGMLSIFSSILLGRAAGQRINNCAPFDITVNTQIILLVIINWDIQDFSYVSHINTAYRTKFNSFAKLFGVKNYNVLTKSIASSLFEWIS